MENNKSVTLFDYKDIKVRTVIIDVNFDLKGVWFISTSFSDELFAKGKKEFGMVFKILNVKNDLMKASIKQALITREKFTVA